MGKNKIISLLVFFIAVISVVASGFGIFSDNGPGPFEHKSIRGQTIQIFGKGIYQHMPADVAIQGIAQDYVTLFLAIPLLLISLMGFRKKSIQAHFILAGTLGYFLVTYLFYLTMGMYNIMFLSYVVLLGLTFFAFFLTVDRLNQYDVTEVFTANTPHKFVGWFLILNSVIIEFLWLSIIIPPLLDGSIYPPDLNHFTTLIVQGLDLGLLLPISFILGYLLMKKDPFGFSYGTIYIIFLSVLMTALTAKVIAMAMADVNVVPAIFIIPSINIITILSAFLMIKNVKKKDCWS
ncbi:hypothetical protein [Salinimicrobium sediminilitoris]|uniref:hypothetical protein n=1 Tax=Salinimicrobium sediminilitoris TaxID=2876715 RepID=UPI001E3F8B5E|nr:hypothetical protein [Salinimicrobium sediminilitoris]MCC8361343.1 hypothetical protein [Salinimicrobium sediminilitoris]